MWYGLTREEVVLLCERENLKYRFMATADPKAGTAPFTTAADVVQKVVRVKEEDGRITFLLGHFIEERRKLEPSG